MLLPVCILLLAVPIGLLSVSRYIDERAEFSGKLDTVLATYSLLFSEPLQNEKSDEISAYSVALISDPDIATFTLTNRHGEVVESFGEGDVTNNDFFRSEEINYLSEEGVTKVGRLEIALSEKRITEHFTYELYVSLGLLLVLGVSILVSVNYTFQRYIGAPLAILVEAIRHYTQRGDVTPIKSRRKDEFGEIISAFNDMVQVQATTQLQLEEHQRDLENQIELKTGDLQVQLAENKIASNKLALEKNRVQLILNRVQLILDLVESSVFNLSLRGEINLLNVSACKLLEISGEQCVGKKLTDLLTVHGSSEPVAVALHQAMAGSFNSEKPLEVAIESDDQILHCHMNFLTLRDEQQNIESLAVFIRDITAQKKVTEALEYKAHHDSLTGLLNRRGFESYLYGVLTRPEDEDQLHVLCFIDLDKFKSVNDKAGHATGDEVLVRLSQGFKAILRKGDQVARFGGDEFALLLEYCDEAHGLEICEKLRAFVKNLDFESAGQVFPLSLSMGAIVFESGCGTMKNLMARADEGCYRVKSEGRDAINIEHY